MNHRELLIKYMVLVLEHEGIDYLDYYTPVKLTDEEKEELKEISDEAFAIYNKT